MTNPYFIARDNCPICSSDEIGLVYEHPYNEEPIRGYLDSFYSPQGGVEVCYLENVTYSLMECQNCFLIFQKNVPNDELMERIYDRWIDPELAFIRHLEQDNLEKFSYIAQEIMQLMAYFGKVPSELKFFDFGMGWGKRSIHCSWSELIMPLIIPLSASFIISIIYYTIIQVIDMPYLIQLLVFVPLISITYIIIAFALDSLFNFGIWGLFRKVVSV